VFVCDESSSSEKTIEIMDELIPGSAAAAAVGYNNENSIFLLV
jgi:hypothetical protein